MWQLGVQLDHLGIVLVMWSSMVPSNYFGFYCSQRLLYFYNMTVLAPPPPLFFFDLLLLIALLRQQYLHWAVRSSQWSPNSALHLTVSCDRSCLHSSVSRPLSPSFTASCSTAGEFKISAWLSSIFWVSVSWTRRGRLFMRLESRKNGIRGPLMFLAPATRSCMFLSLVGHSPMLLVFWKLLITGTRGKSLDWLADGIWFAVNG